MKRIPALLALLPLLFALGSCAGKFPTYYSLDFTRYPIPVILNEGSGEGRSLSATVKDSMVQSNPTMAYSYNSTDASGTTWRHDVVETWNLPAMTSTNNVPAAVQIFAATTAKDRSLRLKKIHLRNFIFFLMGAVGVETKLDVEALASEAAK